MAPRVGLDELRYREYWRPVEAARVLGRGAGFWRQAFDAGHVDGYIDPAGRARKCPRRYLLAASCREYLLGLSKRAVRDDEALRIKRRQDQRSWLAEMRERMAAEGGSARGG